MDILTPSGYRPAIDCLPGDEVCAFQEGTGAPIINRITAIEWVPVWEPGRFIRINGAQVLFEHQSIWANGNVTHAFLLKVGDTIYDDLDGEVTVTSVEVVDDPETGQRGWFRLEVDGDHTYIADGLTLHNASRFWVGGTGNWDAAGTSHWSGSSGGGSGSSTPTTSDAVTIDANSGGGTITATATINMASLTHASGATTGLSTSSQTVNNAGALAWSDNASATLDITNSTWNQTGSWSASPNPARFVATGSTFNFTPSSFGIGNALAFGTLVLKAANPSITASYTYVNLTWAPTSPASTSTLTFSVNPVISGTFTATGAATTRLLIGSTVRGTQRTISAATVTVSYCDFEDIVGTGGGWDIHTATGGAGDAGNNSGITFTTPVTQHWTNTNGGNWSAAANWTSAMPLPQDSAVMDCAFGASKTVTFDTAGVRRTGSVDWSGATGAPTFAASSSVEILGSYVGLTGQTVSGALVFTGRSGQTINGNGQSIAVAITIGITGVTAPTISLAGNVTTASSLTLNAATLALGNYNFTCQTLPTITGTVTNTGGKVVITGNAATTSTTSSAVGNGTVIDLNYSGSTGTRTNNPITSGVVASAFSYKFSAGSDTVTLSANGATAKDVDFTGFSGIWGGTGTHTIGGNLTIPSGMTVNSVAAVTFAPPSGTADISIGITFDRPITINAPSATVRLAAALTLGATRDATLTAGTFDLNGYTVTVRSFVRAAGTAVLKANGGTLAVANSGATAFNNAAPSNFSTSTGSGVGTISMTSASAKTFVGAGTDFSSFKLSQDGAGALTITGANHFADVTNTAFGDILFTAGTTTTVDAFTASGNAGNQLQINSASAAAHTLSKSSGTVSVSYCTITNSHATGGAAFNAYTTNGNIDGGGNTGWNFSAVLAVDLASTGSSAVSFASAALKDSALSSAGASAVAFAGAALKDSSLTSTGVSTVAFAGMALAQSALTATGVSTVAFDAIAVTDAVLTIAGASAVAFGGAQLNAANLTSAGASAVAFATTAIHDVDFTATGASAAAFQSLSLFQSNLAAIGNSAAAFAGLSAGLSDLAITGNSALSMISAATKEAVFASSGASTVVWATSNFFPAVFTSAGASDVAFFATGIFETTLTIAGASATAFVGAQLTVSTLAATGNSAVSFNSAVVSSADLAVTGASAVAFVGLSAGLSNLISVGASAVSFVGQGLSDATLAATGNSTTSFNSAALKPASFAITGRTTLNFVSEAAQQTSFAISGASVVAFAGRQLNAANFASAGASTPAFVTAALKASRLTSEGSSAVLWGTAAQKAANLNIEGASNVVFLALRSTPTPSDRIVDVPAAEQPPTLEIRSVSVASAERIVYAPISNRSVKAA